MSLLDSLLTSAPTDAAVQIASDAVSVAVLAGGRGLAVQAFAVEPLPPGSVTASLTSTNVPGRAAVVGALRQALDRIGARPRRVALVIPDSSARVSLLRFDTVPSRQEDLDQLVRWQLRRAAPFSIDDAVVTYAPGVDLPGSGSEFVTVAARRDVVREYESVCEELDMHPGLVDIATVSLVGLVLAGTSVSGDQLVVHMRPESTSLVILRNDRMIFFSSRAEDERVSLDDAVHQSSMYYQDRLAGRGFARVVFSGTGPTASAFELARRQLEERVGKPIEVLDPARVVTMSDRVTVAPALWPVLAPLAGLLARQREGTVAA